MANRLDFPTRSSRPPDPPDSDAPLSEKLAWLALVRPSALRVVEMLVDHAIEQTEPPSTRTK